MKQSCITLCRSLWRFPAQRPFFSHFQTLISFVDLNFSKYECWFPHPTFSMNLDTKRLVDMLPRNRGASSKNAGYITPPLHSPVFPSKTSSRRRIGVVALLILMLLYLCGFTVPGYRRENKKVVIILAANIGGGDVPVRIRFNGRCVGY